MRYTLLFVLSAVASIRADEPRAERLEVAIARGLTRVERGSLNYTSNRSCFSCHHQMALPVLTLAKQKGFAVSEFNLFVQQEFTRETFRPKLDRIRQGQAIAGANTMAAYALFILEAAGQEPDETTAGLVEFLMLRQKPDGSWPAVTDRPPTEGSPFTNAALALRALKVYGLDVEGVDAKQRQRIKTSWERGRDWLKSNTPKTTEDRAFHLRALVEGDLGRAAINAARDDLIRHQRDDGGWSQLEKMTSDAYATAIVLAALNRAAVPPSDAAVRKGVDYLLRTQKNDGGWLVETRSRPVQIFFDNGDPGGKSQFISFAATNWALLALLQAYERR